MNAEKLVDYAKSLDCIHCGLCLRTCPTYRLSGVESSSPRGRIHLMRAVAEGALEPDADFAEEMDFCLVCRHCESVCPAGVQFGAMMEFTRDGLAHGGRQSLLAKMAHRVGFGAVLPSRKLVRAAATLLGLAQRTGLLRLVAPLLGERGRSLVHLPRVPSSAERRALPDRVAATSERTETVAVLEGCVMPDLYGRVNRATVAVLAASGAECRVPSDRGCCGALHAHNGELETAHDLARRTIAAFDEVRDERGEPCPVVVNSAGCGAHMKEYGRLLESDPEWRDRARAFGARVRDLSEHLAEPGRRERLARAATSSVSDAFPNPVTFDDPCHLCHGQGVRAQPRDLLDAVPGLERVELEESESCCGSAGIYSLLRPKDSAGVFETKLEALARSGARTLVTANPGCQLQWESGLARAGVDVKVAHVAEVIARACGG